MAKKKQNKSKNEQIQSCTLYVDGMHCASCEVLIEKKLLKQDGVESVDASVKDNRVMINFKNSKKVDVNSLNTEFLKDGYQFSTRKFKSYNKPLVQFKNGNLILDPKKVRTYFLSIIVVVSLIIAFFIFESLQLGQYVSVDTSSALPAFLVLGLVAGMSSCAALVGGLLLSMIKQWNELYIDADSKVEKSKPHIMFHVGRLISFTLFGGLLGLLGEVISLNNVTFFAVLTILISVVMLLLALQMLGVERAQRFKFTAPKSLTRFAANEENFQGKYMPFAIGALTFILPCGFTLIAQTIALTSGSFLHGAMIMLFFALGTLPTLLVISYSGLAFNSKPHLTAKFNLIAGLIIVFFVIYNINGQMNVLGWPSLSDISFGGGETLQEGFAPINANGEYQMDVTAIGFEYQPTTPMKIEAGKPAILVVDNKGIQGCGSFMAANELIDNFVSLRPGINSVDLGNPAKGTYKLTCSMGMVRPVTITVI